MSLCRVREGVPHMTYIIFFFSGERDGTTPRLQPTCSRSGGLHQSRWRRRVVRGYNPRENHLVLQTVMPKRALPIVMPKRALPIVMPKRGVQRGGCPSAGCVRVTLT